MTIYISVPMTGRTVKEVEAEIRQLKKDFPFYKKGTKFVTNLDFFKICEKSENPVDPLIAMAVAYNQMAEADAIMVSPNWRKSKGCRLEVAAAIAYNVPIYGLKYDETDKLEVIIRKKQTAKPAKKAKKTTAKAKKTAIKK